MNITDENYKQLDILFQDLFNDHLFLGVTEDVAIQSYQEVFSEQVDWEI